MRKVVLVCAVLLAGALISLAVDFAGLKAEGYVSDFARVLDPTTRAALENYCARVEAATGAEIAVVTLDTLAGEPIEDVANSMFRKWGVGKKGKDEGLMLLLVTQDRRMRLEVGYGLEPIIPDGFSGRVLRSMAPALRQQRYGDAIAEALQVLGSRIAQAKGVTLDVPLPRRSRPRGQPIPWPLVLGGLAVLFWATSAFGGRRGGGSGGSFLLGMIAGNMMGRGFGGGGGGGFGGFDSGGGFGGFGGGDSGGGGASGSW